MTHKKATIITCLLLLICSLSGISQSRKSIKMYNHYASMEGTTIKKVPAFAIKMGVNLTASNPTISKIATKIDDIRIMNISSVNADDIEERIAGKKYKIEYHGTKDVWVKRCFMTVKEAHLLIHKRNKTQIISVYGHVNIKYLKKLNEEYLEKGTLPDIPFLFQ